MSPTARKVPATAPVLLKKPVALSCWVAIFAAPGAELGLTVATSTVRKVVCPTIVTTEVRVTRLPCASVCDHTLVDSLVTGAVMVCSTTLVAVKTSVATAGDVLASDVVDDDDVIASVEAVVVTVVAAATVLLEAGEAERSTVDDDIDEVDGRREEVEIDTGEEGFVDKEVVNCVALDVVIVPD